MVDRYSLRRSRGFGIASMLFVIVGLAALGVGMSTVTQSQQKSQALDALATQAYHAARAGVQYGMQRALAGDCPATWGFPLAQWGGRFRIDGTCVMRSYVDGVDPVNLYTVTATACNAVACNADGSAPGYLERQLTATVQGP